MFFTKPTYVEIRLPFRFVEIPADIQLGWINIEAYGNVFGKNKYCYAWYELKNSNMYHNGDFEQMIELLKKSSGKMVKVTLKIKKGIPQDFKIDVNSLAEAYNDKRFKSLSLLGWGYNDKSFEELPSNLAQVSMKNDMLFQVVKKQVDAFDAYGLLEGGAAQDEFDIESNMIVGRLKKGMTVYSIAEIFAQVMNTQFENIFSADEFVSYAEQVEKFLNRNE